MQDKSTDKIQLMFDQISARYDFFNDVISCFTHRYVKKKALKALCVPPGACVLDLCCGSGDLGKILKKMQPSCTVLGADISEKMLDIAKNKNPNIEYSIQNAENLDFAEDTFDFVVMGFGLRNIEHPETALKEVLRVLKPGGKFLQLDFGKKNIFSKIFDKFTLSCVKIFTNDIAPYNYLINSKNEFPPPEELAQMYKSVGFKDTNASCLLFDVISYQIAKKIR